MTSPTSQHSGALSAEGTQSPFDGTQSGSAVDEQGLDTVEDQSLSGWETVFRALVPPAVPDDQESVTVIATEETKFKPDRFKELAEIMTSMGMSRTTPDDNMLL